MAKPRHLKEIIPLLLALLIIILLVIFLKYWINSNKDDKVEGFDNYINNYTKIDKNNKNVKKSNYVVYCFWTGNNEMSENRKKCLNSIYQNIGVPVKFITLNNLNNYILSSNPLHP